MCCFYSVIRLEDGFLQLAGKRVFFNWLVKRSLCMMSSAAMPLLLIPEVAALDEIPLSSGTLVN